MTIFFLMKAVAIKIMDQPSDPIKLIHLIKWGKYQEKVNYLNSRYYLQKEKRKKEREKINNCPVIMSLKKYMYPFGKLIKLPPPLDILVLFESGKNHKQLIRFTIN